MGRTRLEDAADAVTVTVVQGVRAPGNGPHPGWKTPRTHHRDGGT